MPSTRLHRLTAAAITATVALSLTGCSLIHTSTPPHARPTASSTPTPERATPDADRSTTEPESPASTGTDLSFGGASLPAGAQPAWDLHIADLKAKGWNLDVANSAPEKGFWRFTGPNGDVADLAQFHGIEVAADLDDRAASEAALQQANVTGEVNSAKRIPLDDGGSAEFLSVAGSDVNGKTTVGAVRVFRAADVALGVVVRSADAAQAHADLDTVVGGLSISTFSL